MTIPKKLLTHWKGLQQRGDYALLSEACGRKITPQSFAQAFYNGSCSDAQFLIIAKFYEAREPERAETMELKDKLLKQYADAE